MHNISSLWFFWAISLGFDKSWFGGDDLPSPMVQSLKNHPKKNQIPVFGSSLNKKTSHPTPGGTVNGWTLFCQDAIATGGFSRCWDRKALGAPMKNDSKIIRVWDWIIQTFLRKKIDEEKISNDWFRFKPPQSLKNEMFKSLFLNNKFKKERYSYHLLSTFCHLFWTHF